MDILICIVPKIEPLAPTVGPALLKTCLENRGLTAKVCDFNIELYHYLDKLGIANKYYNEDDSLFNCHLTDLPEAFVEFYKEHRQLFESWVDDIVAINPRWVGFSLLSRWSQSAAVKLSQLIREKSSTIKIVWGGSQIATNHEEMDKLRQQGIIDCFINGDGEEAIVDLLINGLDSPLVNTCEPLQIKDLSNLPIPNYDDIEWQKYKNADKHVVYITASRGCVKRCSFCNVQDIWPQFYMRSAESIINEVRNLINRYNRLTFKFTDSLINGNMKIYRQLLHELTQVKKEHDDFRWISQWIVRNQLQSPESDYDLLESSGCEDLEIGVESFSESVRHHMGKKFTNQDIWWCLEQLRKRDIMASVLMISGYPTETQKDHDFTIKILKRLYKENKVFNKKRRYINFSFTPMILNGTLIQKLGPNLINASLTDWTYYKNTKERRLANYIEILELINQNESTNTSRYDRKMLQLYHGVTKF